MDHAFGGSLLFDGFDLDLGAPELRRGGRSVPIQLQPLKVLSFLASRPGEIVSRASLRQHLWQEQTFVDFEAGLNFCIRQIRRTLGDDARRPRLVETLRRRGYRFMGNVVRCHASELRRDCRERRITVTLCRPATERDDYAVVQITEKIAELLVSSYGNGIEPAPVAHTLRQASTARSGDPDQPGQIGIHGAGVGQLPQAEFRISRRPMDGSYLVTLQVE
jgi:DNA-binding winged helix-turn-helix (wHTH) protein